MHISVINKKLWYMLIIFVFVFSGQYIGRKRRSRNFIRRMQYTRLCIY